MLCYEYICGREIWEIRAKECRECVWRDFYTSSLQMQKAEIQPLLPLRPPLSLFSLSVPLTSSQPITLSPPPLPLCTWLLLCPRSTSKRASNLRKQRGEREREGERGSEAGSHTLSSGGSSRRGDGAHSLTHTHTRTHNERKKAH